MNNVNLVGRITNDLELRKSQSGMSILRFNVAINRRVANANGEREADFPTCIAFGKTAENIATYCAKGHLIAIEGRIQTGRYQNNEGQTIYTTDVVVNNFTFIESKQSKDRVNSNPTQSTQSNFSNPTQAPFDPFKEFETGSSNTNILDDLDISDDELPF
jgi:single-strand DNA-binding protein